MQEPKPSSLEDTFRPAFEEISRRSNVASATSDFLETAYFERSTDMLNLPFHLPGQEFALISMGTSVLAPRPVEQTRPALRVYGIFETRDDAKEHAEVVRAIDSECSLLIVRTRQWSLMPQTEDALEDVEVASRRLEKRLTMHRERQMEESDTFTRMVTERSEPPRSTVQEEEDPEERREVEEAEALVYPRPKRLRSGAEVRGQSAVSLSVIPDNVTGECLINILGCFETMADADNWTRNVATRHTTGDDIYVAPMCEWLFPNGDTKTAKTHYRVNELQRIMDAAERNPQAVRDYKEWKREQDRLRDQDRLREHNTVCATEEDAHPDAVATEGGTIPEVIEESDSTVS